MIDIHTHIIPQLDDGPQSVEESLLLIRQAAEQGVTDIIATSHYRLPLFDNSDYLVKYNKLLQVVNESDITINFHTGNEIYLDEYSIEALKLGRAFSLANSNYVLIELPQAAIYPIHYEFLRQLRKLGYEVILAHLERYSYLMKDSNVLQTLVASGCKIQMSSGFIINNIKIAKKMIEKGYVHFVASDLHNMTYRPPNMSLAKEVLSKSIGYSEAMKLLVNNPNNIIKNKLF